MADLKRGRMRCDGCMRGLWVLVVVVLPCLSDPRGALAGAWNVAALMHLLAKNPGGSARFVETKSMAVLDRPVEASGRLRYRRPDYLEIQTLKPTAQRLVLRGDRMELTLGHRTRVVSLRQHPGVGAMIAAIRGTLAGNQQALMRRYRLQLQGAPQRWMLALHPVTRRVAGNLRSVEISGHEDQVRRIVVLQKNGDRAQFVIQDLKH